MKVKANSAYEFIKELLRNGVELTFTSSSLSHGQGASVCVNEYYDSKKKIDEELKRKSFFPNF
jgi:hypothetical protein